MTELNEENKTVLNKRDISRAAAVKNIHRRRMVIGLIIAAVIVAAVCVGAAIYINTPKTFDAAYLGVQGYGMVGRAEVLDPDSKLYRFLKDGREIRFRIDCGNIFPEDMNEKGNTEDTDYYGVLPSEEGAYPIQNMLHEGETYSLTVKKDRIISCEPLTEHGTFTPVVTGTPGKLTLKNFLQTAVMPVGNVLYVYGGGWDWQDIGASVQARTIGVSEMWTDTFEEEDASYLYRNDADPAATTYPFGEWNQYYYKGLDCSGYVGWALYNTLYDESLEHPGLVCSAAKIARTFAEKYGLGIWNHDETVLRPGDIISTSGHVVIYLGKCDDGSSVVLESNILESHEGTMGGGVQLSVYSEKGENDTDCEAYKLVKYYYDRYYPEWSSRYPVRLSNSSGLSDFTEKPEYTGVFHWNILEKAPGAEGLKAGGLEDPEGLSEMTAEEIMKELYGSD